MGSPASSPASRPKHVRGYQAQAGVLRNGELATLPTCRCGWEGFWSTSGRQAYEQYLAHRLEIHER